MLDEFKFEKRKVATGIQIAYRIGGKGRPLLLLHGYPQTHLMWAKIAPRLAKQFTVVMTGRKIKCPLLVLWGNANPVLQTYDMLNAWRQVSDNTVEGRELPCGHYLPEEVPQDVTSALQSFFL